MNPSQSRMISWTFRTVRRVVVLSFFAFLLATSSITTLMAQERFALPILPPEDLGFDPSMNRFLDDLGNGVIEKDYASGCVIAVGRKEGIAYLKGFGERQTLPEPLPMEPDTLFDLASITKSVATSISMAILYEEGKYALDDPIAKYIPEFGQEGKDAITIRQCLTHTSGMKPYWILNYPHSEPEIWAGMNRQPLINPPGTVFRYSCHDFLIQGRLIEVLTGQKLKDFVSERVYKPLGMADTMFCPPKELTTRCATTEFDKDRGWIRGIVHDPQSWYLGGNAGNAGCFSTAPDLAVFGAMMIGKGTLTKPDGTKVKIIDESTFNLFTGVHPVSSGVRGLGWDKRSPYSSNRPWNFSPESFGHGGFTGTVFWIDPTNNLYAIFLASRLHPERRTNAPINHLGSVVGTIAFDSLRDPIDPDAIRADAMSKVYQPSDAGDEPEFAMNGIDVLAADQFRLLAGRKVGLVTNHTGLDRDGVPTAVRMKEAGIDLVALFSPEHGIAGQFDQAQIDDSRDPVTGLPVFSLYGDTRRPTPTMLKGIDTLVFDIQDIGARFYTYISTMGMAMEAAADLGLDFVVLDRVNPIGGACAGPIADPGEESFINFSRLAVRHGMTVGELALLINAEHKMNLKLTIVPVRGWKRSEYFDQTGFPWVNPSPNMRSLTAATLYPGVCLAEGTGYSVGRGTETPFELMGAPWIDGERLADRMNALVATDGKPTPEKPLAGIRFEPVTFTPNASLFKDEQVSGIRFILTDRNVFEPVLMGVALMKELIAAYPDKITDKGANHLLMNRDLLGMIKEGKSLTEIQSAWMKDFDRFQQRRALFLIYE